MSFWSLPFHLNKMKWILGKGTGIAQMSSKDKECSLFLAIRMSRHHGMNACFGNRHIYENISSKSTAVFLRILLLVWNYQKIPKLKGDFSQVVGANKYELPNRRESLLDRKTHHKAWVSIEEKNNSSQ